MKRDLRTDREVVGRVVPIGVVVDDLSRLDDRGRLHEYAVRVASDDSPLAAEGVDVELSICDCDMPFV